MSKHTPGPWRIHRLEGDFEVFWYDGEDGVDSYTYVAKARQYDNARLIAAAPELLEALLGCVCELDDLGVLMNEETAACSAIAKAAIAKATSEEA